MYMHENARLTAHGRAGLVRGADGRPAAQGHGSTEYLFARIFPSLAVHTVLTGDGIQFTYPPPPPRPPAPEAHLNAPCPSQLPIRSADGCMVRTAGESSGRSHSIQLSERLIKRAEKHSI